MICVIVLNGGSSSGKSSIARWLQRLLEGIWLSLSIDDLIRALPEAGDFVTVGSGGSVDVGEDFRKAEFSWHAGIAAIARTGTGVVVDDVFLGGLASQERLAVALAGVPIIWVGVMCRTDVAEARERDRGDRTVGMARLQAEKVHEGVVYDLVVDSSDVTPRECASAITAYVRRSGA